MVSSDIWMGSGATVSMIPEKQLYLGAFSSIAAASNNRRVITLSSNFTGNFRLVDNLYRGCYLNIYSTSSGGVITGAVVTTAGDSLTSDLTVVTSAEINAGQPASGSNGELLLTLSAHSTAFTFVDNDASKYEDGSSNDGSIRIFADNGDGTSTSIDVIFADDSGSTPTLNGDVTLTVDIAEDAEGAEIAEAVRLALVGSGEAITATRSGNVLTVTNTNGGDVSNSTESTDGGVTLVNTSGGAVTAVSVQNGGSGYSLSAGGQVTITSTGTDAVVTVSVSSADTLTDRVLIQANAHNTLTVNDSLVSGITSSPSSYYGIIEQYGCPVPAPAISSNPALLSDTWFGLVTGVTIPTTSQNVQPMNLVMGGTRNHIYQYKGIETTSGGSLSITANSFWPLYYALGRKTIDAVTNESAETPTDEFTVSGAVPAAGTTKFIYSPDEDSLHRVERADICPPLLPTSTLSNHKLIDSDNGDTNFITYTFTEENGHELPSFAMEYTLKKADQSATVGVDSAKENVYTKIYPGTVVTNLAISANAQGPIDMQLSLAHKNTFVAPTNYQTLNGVTDPQNFINYGGREGQSEFITNNSASDMEDLMKPFFFADGTISLFGQDYIRLASMELTIENGVQEMRYIGRYDKNSVVQLTGQRSYSLRFTGHVTDSAIFDELQNQLMTAISTTTSEIVLRFTKDNGEELTMKFQDYMVTDASFPVNNDRGPIEVSWTIVPLVLSECTHKTYWAIQG